jgi:hypothetical protein
MLESVQRQAARFTLGDYRRSSSVTAMIGTLQWDTLEHRRLLAQANMFFKIHHGIVNISLPQYIKQNPRPARRQHLLRYHHPYANLDLHRYSFFPRIIPVWNLLPSGAVFATSPEAFNLAAMPFIRQLQPPASGKSW